MGKKRKGELEIRDRNVMFFSEWIKTRDVGKSYLAIDGHVSEREAEIRGEAMLRELEVEKVLKVYGLDMDVYLKQLKGGLEATKWIDDGEGMLEIPDHSVRRQYHKILGEMLKLEEVEKKVGDVVLKGLIVLSGIESGEKEEREIIEGEGVEE